MAQPMAMPMPAGVPPLQPGQQPTPQQVQAMQQQFFAEAARRGLTPQQFGEQLKAQAMQQQQQAQAGGQGQQQQQQGQGGPQGAAGPQAQIQMPARGQQVPIQPGPPKPEAIALAKFLQSQTLKSRPCIFNGQRKEMFKGISLPFYPIFHINVPTNPPHPVKRAIRALHSPAYTKARSKKNSLLPAVTDRASAENIFKMLPISMLALRVAKLEDGENPAHGQPGHQHGGGGRKSKQKGKKGLWNVKIEPQQDANDEYHYIWLYEGSQWKQKLYSIGALVIVLALVLFPLWPYTLRKGVWWLSMACLGLLAAFFGLAIVRLIIFLITIVTTKPGIWIYPNLFEDVGFFDSFKPGWEWREVSLLPGTLQGVTC